MSGRQEGHAEGPGKAPATALACRWAARITSTAVLALIGAIAIGEGIPMPFSRHFSTPEILGFFGLLAAVLGYLAGWVWELPGGLATLVGICLIFGPTLGNGRLPWIIAVMATPAALHLASWALRRPSPPGPASPGPPSGA